MRVDDLERELRAARSVPDPEFAGKLDEWAAAGFPRGGELDPRGPAARPTSRAPGSLRALRERLASIPPRRLLAPAGAAATALVIGAVVIGQSRDTGGVEPGGADEPSAALIAPEQGPGAPVDEGGPDLDGGGSAAARVAEERLTDATARLSLGAPAGEVQEVANGIVSVTDRYGGVVVSSQVTSDGSGARASFELEIPFTELEATLTDLSELGDVISRAQATEDVTARAVRAREDLGATTKRIARLSEQLLAAEGRERKLILRARIDSLRAQAGDLRAELNGVEREARFATVSVGVISADAGASGDWGLDDALEDAGDALAAIAGVALVTLAVLLPLGLLAAVSYGLATRARRARRERSLD